MASELAGDEGNVITARERSGDDSRPASFQLKRTTQGDPVCNPSTSTTKRQKQMVGEQQVHDLVPQDEAFAEEDGDLGSNAAESELGTMGESLEGGDRRNYARATTGSHQEPCAAKVARLAMAIDGKHQLTSAADKLTTMAKATDAAHHLRVADDFRMLTRTLEELRGRLDGRSKDDVEKALSTAKALEVTCTQPAKLAQLGDKVGIPNLEPGNSVQYGCLLPVDPIVKNERDSKTPSSSSSTSDDSISDLLLNAPASVCQRQKHDPELREKIHKIETDYWKRRISRKSYNEERAKLYTDEEAKEARIVWPQVRSPAGYRENEMKSWNRQCLEGGSSWDDTLLEFGYGLEEDELRGDEEAAKKRWRDKIEDKFKDPEAKMAEYKRWEKIREVEIQYDHNQISRKEYNKQRFALYTEEERKEKGVVWPPKKHKECYSPAGFVEAVFDQYDQFEDGPDWQTRMDFHYPYALSPTDKGEVNLCELCIPLIEEHRDCLKARRLQMEKLEALRAEQAAAKDRLEWEERWKEREKKKQERILAKKNGLPCPQCNRKFVDESALRMHAAAKHKE